MRQTENVVIAVQSFATLCHHGADLPLSLDVYQRPYVWGTDKLDQLIADLYPFTGVLSSNS